MAASPAGTLGLRTATRIAWREMRSSSTRFLFVVLSVAIGVGALTGVRAFSAAFRAQLLQQARSILAADVSATVTHQLSPQQQAALAARLPANVRSTQVTQTVSMASTPQDPNPLLVSLKIVDPAAYPFYGKLSLLSGKPLRAVLNDATAVVAPDVLIRLKTQVGQRLQVGSQLLTIADVEQGEPDALVETFSLGPRVIITRNAAVAAGLLQPGSRATERYLFALPPTADVGAFRTAVQQALPEAQVTDFRETNPTVTQGVDRATSVLSLVSLIALVLGAMAVAMAMRAHLQQSMDSIAMMKGLGATSGAVLRIYIVQTLMLGSAGGIAGVLLGIGVDRLLPVLFHSLIEISPGRGISVQSSIIGFVTGLLTTQLFTLPPLLEVRRVKPVLILRRQMAEEDFGYARFWSAVGLRQRLPQLVAGMGILAGLAVIAAWLASSRIIGIGFAVGLLFALLALLGAARLLLWCCRKFLSSTRLLLPQWLRHGLANLYRPGNQTASVLAALGVGVMLSMTIYFVQKTVVSDLRDSAPKDLPNAFFVDIAPSEIAGVQKLVNAQPGIAAPMEAIPVVAARMISINGKTPTSRHSPEDGPPDKGLNPTRERTVNLSWSAKVPAGVTMQKGAWWQPDEQAAVVSIADRTAQRFGMGIGSTIVFDASGHTVTATVVAVHKYNNLRAGSRSEFLFPPAALQGLPTIWYGAVHMAPDQVPDLQRVMFASFPTVSVINLADALKIVNDVVDKITQVIEFLAAFCIFSAIVLLASSVAGTRFRRIRETVVLKTLGATRARIGAILTVEFLLIGTLGATVGLVFAHGLSSWLLTRFELHYRFQGTATVLAIVATALLATGAGWAACFRILGQKPLAVLREE